MDYQAAYYALLQARGFQFTLEHAMVAIPIVGGFIGVVWKLARQSKQIETNENTAKLAHDRIGSIKKDRADEMSEVSARLETIGNTLARFEERMASTAREMGELKDEIRKRGAS